MAGPGGRAPDPSQPGGRPSWRVRSTYLVKHNFEKMGSVSNEQVSLFERSWAGAVARPRHLLDPGPGPLEHPPDQQRAPLLSWPRVVSTHALSRADARIWSPGVASGRRTRRPCSTRALENRTLLELQATIRPGEDLALYRAGMAGWESAERANPPG